MHSDRKIKGRAREMLSTHLHFNILIFSQCLPEVARVASKSCRATHVLNTPLLTIWKSVHKLPGAVFLL